VNGEWHSKTKNIIAVEAALSPHPTLSQRERGIRIPRG
jgi:hypothetical protein